MLVRGLVEEDFSVDVSISGDEGLEHLLLGSYDLCILDVLLPGLDGFAVLRRARREGITVPILILTARDAVADRVRGLNSGADDYLVKPFVVAELFARIQALLRRSPLQRGRLRTEGLDIHVDVDAHRVFCRGQEVKLTQKQFALLELLLRHRGRALTRAMILQRVWGYGFETGTNIVDVQVAHLRQKLDALEGPSLIETVRGLGYRIGDGPEEDDSR